MDVTQNKARRQQMIAFYTSGLTAIAACLLARRGVAARKFVPRQFDQNHRPPSSNIVKDAVVAVAYASGITIPSFACAFMGIAWVMDVHTIRDFSLLMKAKFGAAASEKAIEKAIAAMDEDKELKELQDNIISQLK